MCLCAEEIPQIQSFEFLTGNSMAFLPQGSIPYQQYITKELPALPAYLASLGYETVATHPYYADAGTGISISIAWLFREYF